MQRRKTQDVERVLCLGLDQQALALVSCPSCPSSSSSSATSCEIFRVTMHGSGLYRARAPPLLANCWRGLGCKLGLDGLAIHPLIRSLDEGLSSPRLTTDWPVRYAQLRDGGTVKAYAATPPRGFVEFLTSPSNK
jgi:hypothetical protein